MKIIQCNVWFMTCKSKMYDKNNTKSQEEKWQ